MAVIINGTTGITDVNGTAAAPAITGTDTDTGVFFGTNTVSLSTNGTERLQVDASGNAGLGVTPSAWGPTYKAVQFGSYGAIECNNSNKYVAIASNHYNGGSSGDIYIANGYATRYYQDGAGAHVWNTASSGTAGASITFTQAMTLDSSGNLLVGSTSAAWTGGGGGAIQFKGITSHAGQNGAFQNNGINLEWRSGALRVWVDTTDLGTVQFASDYRLKKDVQTQTASALERIAQVRPVTFEFGDYGDLFKSDGVTREGFIAHELAEIIPSAVDGQKDCENQIQTLRLDALCSVMVKAIQEQQAMIASQSAIITQLQADVAALKGNA